MAFHPSKVSLKVFLILFKALFVYYDIVFYSNSTERRIEFNYTKYGDTPVCLYEEFNLPNQKVQLAGFGLSLSQGEEIIGEQLAIDLRTLQNEECYQV